MSGRLQPRVHLVSMPGKRAAKCSCCSQFASRFARCRKRGCVIAWCGVLWMQRAEQLRAAGK